MFQGAGLRISSLNSGENTTKNLKYDCLPISSEPVWMCVCRFIWMHRNLHTRTHRETGTQIPNSYSACSQHLTLTCLPLSYNFTRINLAHLITVPAPRPQRSHILHTPLPPFCAQPQLWNPTTNNSLACFVPLVLLTGPPTTNWRTSCNRKSKLCIVLILVI